MNGERVGTWSIGRGASGRFQYDAGWLESPRIHPLSLSLPFSTGNVPLRGAFVDDWFDNLLPDSDVIWARIARHFGVGADPQRC